MEMAAMFCNSGTTDRLASPSSFSSCAWLQTVPALIGVQAKESDLQRAQMMMKLKESRLARLQSELRS